MIAARFEAFCLAWLLAAPFEPRQTLSAASFTTAPGWTVTTAAAPPDVRFPMFACFDERGRLFVAESSGLDLYAELQKLTRKCRIRALEDRDGDGRFESASIFADQLVFPMGLAWHEGKLFVADPPLVVSLEDTDGDGRADRRTPILGDFGHQDNGSLHGLIVGPDGWLYMTMGQPDGYRFKKPDGTVIEGKTGALIRCRLDGSDVEVVCRGFENLIEIDFMPSGEIIGTDNWFTLPAAGVRDALVHLVEGGLYPLAATQKGTPMLISGPFLPAIASYPAVALSGFTRGRNPMLAGPSRNQFYSAQHNTRKVVQHRLVRELDTFRSEDMDFLATEDPDFHPSDVLEDADGSLIVVDTGSWYIHHCPTGRIRQAPAEGGLYRLRPVAGSAPSDPRGLRLDWKSPSVEALAERLRDPREGVSERAALALSRLGSPAVSVLTQGLESNHPPAVREKATWALSRIPGAHESIVRALESPDPVQVVLAARALGRQRLPAAAPALVRLLSDPEPSTRLAAAEALVWCGGPELTPRVIEALSSCRERFIEHALIHFLHRHSTRSELEKLLDHPSFGVQRAALVLLDQPPFLALDGRSAVRKLSASDPALRHAARDALLKHPEWVELALPYLTSITSAATLTPHELELLNEFPAAFASSPRVVEWVAERLGTQSGTGLSGRHTLLRSITLLPATQLPLAWRSALRQNLASPSVQVRRQAVASARALQGADIDQELIGLVRTAAESPEIRAQALSAVILRHRRWPEEVLEFLFERLGPSEPVSTRLESAELLSQTELPSTSFARFLELARRDASLPPSLIITAARRADQNAASAVKTTPPEWSGPFLDFVESWTQNGGHIEALDLEWMRLRLGEPQRIASLHRQLERRTEHLSGLLSELLPLLTGGDPNRGQGLFLGKAICATCHRVGNQGSISGPDLTKVGAIRAGRDLLESLLLPSLSFAQGYEPYHVELKSGESLSGMRVRGPDTLFILRDASGRETRLDSSQISHVRRGTVSVMPEGLLAALTREEIRDLLSFLQQLK